MSYCRWIDSDAYIYDSKCGVQFYVAGEFDGNLDRLCRTYNEAYQYAKALRDGYGLDVPDYAIEALRSDALEEAEGVCGPNSAVVDLQAENAKLRELLKSALISHDKMCTNRGTCLGCLLFNAKPFAPACPIVSVTRDARELGVEVDG